MNAHHSDGQGASLDTTVISVGRLHALAALLAGEEGATQFACLDLSSQVALFGLFEDLLADVRDALTEPAGELGSPTTATSELP